MYKENIGTLEAIQSICSSAHLHTRNFGFAGTKDKRAYTTQYITAFKITPDRLRGVNTSQRDMIRVGDFKYVKEGLRLGDLKGNQFGVVIR
jgi:tRNA pseudouridine13 synthase